MKLNVKALMLALGILWGAAVFLTGLVNLVWPSYGVAFLQLAASLYPGYDAASSFASVVIGTLYAILDGAVAGLVFAWLYNVFAGKTQA